MGCRCEALRQMLAAVGADEWVLGSCTCFRCSPHWSDSSSPQGSSRRRYSRDASGRWVPTAAIPREARPVEKRPEVVLGVAETGGDAVERP